MQLTIEQFEQIRPVAELSIDGVTLVYHTPNRMTLWRAETLLTKEPATIEWLNAIEPGSVLVDVGANVGMYTVYAAKVRRAQVYAFEPESQNYALLNANILENGLHRQVTAYCLALSDACGLDKLYLSQFSLGGSCHSLGEEVGFDLKPRAAPFVQGISSYTLDRAVAEGVVPQPGYIKLDVDGFEHKVLHGAVETLRNPAMRSLIVELNPHLPEHLALVAWLGELGYRSDPDQVARAARSEGAFKGVGEWVFSRDVVARAQSSVVHTHLPAVIDRTGVPGMAQHVLARLDASAIKTEPFVHAVVDDVFPADYYSGLLAAFPRDEQMIPLSETGRTGGAYRERLVTLFDDEGFSRLTEAQRDCWARLGGWLYSPEFINGVLERFAPYVDARLREIKQRFGKVNVRGDALIVSDKTQYEIGPHTDAAHRLISFLFYLPADASQRAYGTSFYRPKDPSFECKGGPHHPFEQFERLNTLEFIPNRLVIFVRSNRSFHGVERIDDAAVERHLLINNIRLMSL